MSVERGCDSCCYPTGTCRTLKSAAELVHDYNLGPVSISVDSQSIDISSVIKFENVNGIKIVGTSDKTRVTCSDSSESGAGLAFASVHNLVMEDMEFYNCSGTGRMSATIYIQECTNVTLKNITVTSGKTAGLAFSNSVGEILVQNSRFTENGVPNFYLSGGAYAEFTKCYNLQSNYTFEGCRFEGNTANVPSVMNITKQSKAKFHHYGGGLGLIFTDNGCRNNVTISHCEFIENEAYWGGGMFVHFYSSDNGREIPQNNKVVVVMTNFTSNRATRAGGGADVGYSAFYTLAVPVQNQIVFSDCQFVENRANYGGGTALFASYGETKRQETITFKNCVWSGNQALFSPAVDISPFSLDSRRQGFHLIPVFADCMFTGNMIQEDWENDDKSATKYVSTGSFIINEFTVQFEGQIVFRNNKFSALKISSGVVIFQKGTHVQFLNNVGIKGGAIALYGVSSIHIDHNSQFEFIGNHATEAGGAIYYQHYDKHEQTCFIQYVGGSNGCSSVDSEDIVFNFTNNTADLGKSMFATTFHNCYSEYDTEQVHGMYDNLVKNLQCIGSFAFDEPRNESIGTWGSKFELSSKFLRQIPGKVYELPLKIKDEFGNKIQQVSRLALSSNKNLSTDRTHTVDNKVAVYGEPDSYGNLTFYTLGYLEAEISIKISLTQCPPGYMYFAEKKSCLCASDKYSQGIPSCSKSRTQAHLLRGYWIGYVDEISSPSNLFTSPCPLGFCAYMLNCKTDRCLLPGDASQTDLNEFMCGKRRTGLLCGECGNSFSVFYHSHHYHCGKKDKCHFGLLFYFLSEIIPLTVLFTVVVVLDIRFTSGTANGFIFFSQVLDSLSVDARGIIQFPSLIDKLSIGYKIIYGLFNFDFFSVESLSFCLWRQATVLDIIVFKYVTTVFALGLVTVLVLIINYCHCKRFYALKQKISTRNSVIHGLSAFLVICYTQCTKVSFQILTPTILAGINGTEKPAITFYGGIPFFGTKHKSYAIPACICIATFVAIPPLLLLVFPLYFHVLAFFGHGESRATNWASRRIWTVRLKPVLDSFQGCFKGKLRFFAGLYFVYRITILAVGTFSKITLELYITVGVVLVLMLTLHAVAQPYEKRQHNIVDSLMFVNLTIINGCTLYTYKYQADTEREAIVNVLFWIQLILIYLPLVYMCILLTTRFIIKYRKKKKEDAEEHLAPEPQHQDTEYRFIDHELLPYQELSFSAAENQESWKNV